MVTGSSTMTMMGETPEGFAFLAAKGFSFPLAPFFIF